MDAVAVDADRNLFFSRAELLIKFHSHAVKILKVGVNDLGRQTVFLHDFFFCMTAGADLGYRDSEISGVRPCVVVGLVTVGAYGHVFNALTDQGRTMDAFCVDGIDILMALLTPFGIGQFVFPGGDYGMGPMAVGAERGLGVALRQYLEVDAFQGFGIFVEVASPAIFGHNEREIPPAPEIPYRM